MSTFDDMREKHREDTIRILSIFVFFLLVFAFHEQYINVIEKLVKKPENLSYVLEKSWLVLIFTIVPPVVTYFVLIITIAMRNWNYFIDNLIFKRRIKVDRFICQRMLDMKIQLTDNDKQNLQTLEKLIDNPKKCEQIMSLFYRFIEKEDAVNPELKSQAFVYWGDYFSSMMFVVWGVVAMFISIFILLLNPSLTYLRVLILLIILVLIVWNLVEIIYGKTAKKQFEIPETQINEIHRSLDQNLLADLRAEGFFLNNE